MENQEIFRAMFEEATLGIIIVNASGEIKNANPFTEKLFGYKKKELLNQKVEILLPESFRKIHVHHRKNYHENSTPRSIGGNLELFGQRKDGSRFPVEISLSFATTNNEKLSIAYINDVSNIKNTLKELRIKNTAISEGAMPIAFSDLEGNLTEVNPAFAQMWGYDSPEELIGINNEKLSSTKTEVSEINKSIREKGFWSGEATARKKDGSIFNIYVTSNLIFNNNGVPILMLASFIDISTLKKLEEELKNINIGLEEKIKMRTNELEESQIQLKRSLEKEQELGILKSRFVAMASHEFRTPLTSILSSAELIQHYQQTDQQEKRKKHITRIKGSVKNLTNILDDFLSLEKLESGKLSCKPDFLNFKEYVNDVMEEINLSEKKKHEIQFQHSGKIDVRIDPHLVKNILINLLSNAIKYSPKEKAVKLVSKNENGLLEIQVIDSGIGIPKEDQNNMFTRFFRASNVESIQGTGLGLTIVKRYLDLMDGEISFESKESIGTTFNVKIPQQ